MIGQKQRDEIEVPSCTIKTIRQIVYSSEMDIPYMALIGYSNGIGT